MFGLLLAAAVAGAHPADPSPYFLDSNTVVQFDCDAGLGSGFYIGDGKFITARHVVVDEKKVGWPDGHCRINDKPVRILEIGKGAVDYALVSAPVYPDYRAIISCDRFVEARAYYATGYAAGNPWTVTQRLIGSAAVDRDHGNGFKTAMLRGATTEGQSGGPVSDDDGVVHGIISAGPTDGTTEAGIQMLADTPFCKVKQ